MRMTKETEAMTTQEGLPASAGEVYRPVEIRNDEAGFVEFVNSDVPYIVREIDGPVAILLDMETRNVIGYRVYDFAPAGEVGWRMVPAKLTPVMIHAYCEKANSLGFHAFMNASCAWETLLAAAPLPASPTGGDKP